jgi:hypothetical protein
MSAGPLTVYNGTSGVADDGGNSLTDDLNVYYSVCADQILSRYAPSTSVLSLTDHIYTAVWRFRMDHHILSARAAHGARRRLLL